jgi:hypothetical protein
MGYNADTGSISRSDSQWTLRKGSWLQQLRDELGFDRSASDAKKVLTIKVSHK